MNLRNHSTLCPAAVVAMAALLLAVPASALPDHLTVVTTNPHTNAPATLELDRYSLRAPNWEARIYSSPTTYTVLPASQVPEVTTYRGRVVEDGGMVIGGVRPNGTLFAKVNYGCRDSTAAIVSDPYESSNRYSWVIWSLQLTGQTVNTGYVYAPAANEPVSAPAPPANWFNNLGATQNFGGPPPYNNMVTMPLNRVRLVCSANAYSLGTYGNSIAHALLGMESAVNQADYVAARDGGVSYQIQASGIQTYAAGPVDTSAVWGNIAHDIMCWTGDWGVSGGSWVIDYPEDMSGETMVHELGHSLGGPDFCGEQDYQGSMRNTEHTGGGDEMNGVDLYRCLAARANRGYLKSAGYVYYRTPVPTRANQDLVSTNVNTPVSVDVLLNDWNANTTSRADLPIVSFQNPSERGGTVTDLGGGVLRYTPPAGFHGDDVFRYYVGDPSGRFKSLSGVRVLVVDPNTPLVARYPFDETTGVSALDTSGGGRKGTLTGNGSFATDRVPGVGGVGGAIHFSGYVSIFASSPRLTFGNPNPWTGNPTPDPIASYSYDAMDRSQSVSFWYKPDVLPMTGNMGVTHDFHMLYGKHNITSSGFGDGGGIVLGIKNNTLFFVVQMYGPHGYPVIVDSGITPQPGIWYHLVGEIDRENQQVHLYVNGVKYSSAAGTLPAGQFVFGSNCANLGGQNLDGGNMYAAPAGAFDDLRIYTKALTSTEVTDLYEAPGMLPASQLAPTAGQTGVTPLPLLSWAAGRARYQHDVYFGTDAAAVAAASVSTPGIYLGRTSNTSWQITGLLDPVRTYFWRIDEVDGSTIGKGAVWQFTTAVASPACDLLSFDWGGNVGVINGTNVTLVVPYGTNLTTLNPTCTVSPFATVGPASGSTVDFSNSATVPVPYTVTAQDRTTKVYHVTVTKIPPGTACDMLSFNWGAYSGSISGTDVTLMVPFGTDVTALNSACTVSAGATVSPVSGTTRNFTTPQTYTVTAQDGINQKVYTVTVAFNPIIPLTGGDSGEGFAPRVNVFGAVNCNQAGVGAVQNVMFNTNADAFTVSYSLGGSGGSGGTFAVTTSNDTNLNNLLKSGYASGSPGNITVTITGLIPGQEYQMDWLVNSMGATARDVSLRVYRADGTTPLTGSATFRMAGNNTAYDIRQMFTPADTSVKVISSATTTQDWPLLNGIAITYGTAAPSAACDMLGCNWGASSGVISGTAVTLTVPAGTDVTALNPTCTVSPNATVSPVSGTPRNFTSPQTYTVTAQNGITQKVYTVTVVTPAGVAVGSSTLIGTLQYSDTFTETAYGGIANRTDGTYPVPAGGLAVENSYGNPARSWTSGGWSINRDATVSANGAPYVGSGAGTATGMTQTGGSSIDYGIEYGLSDRFVVQFDAYQALDRIDIGARSARDTIGGSGLSVFIRPSGAATEIGLYNGTSEINSGLTSGIAVNTWHNYAVKFDNVNKTIEVFVDQVSRGSVNLATLNGGSHNTISNAAVSVGGTTTFSRLWTDNFQVGLPPATSYNITATAGTGGSINPSGDVSVALNATPTYTITPDIGYAVSDVVLDGTIHLGAVTTYTFAPVTVAHTIAATFAGVPPAVPTGLTAAAGDAKVLLAWTAASGATGYKVKRSATNGGPYTQIGTTTTATHYFDTSVTNGTPYYYVVSATNATGESANTAQAATTPGTPPTAGVIYTDGFNGSASVNLAGQSTTVGGGTWLGSSAWKANGSADPVVGSNGDAVYLPLAVAANAKYTLSLTTTMATGDWFALGFANFASPPSGTEVVPWGIPDGNGNTWSAWMLNHPDGSGTTYLHNVAGLETYGVLGHDLKIVLDTASTGWTAEYFVNGASIRGPVALGVSSANYVMFAKNGGTGTVDNFELSVAPAGGYANWASNNGASPDPREDSNHNGVPNGVEFFMGGTAASPAALPDLVNTADTWTWTIPYDPSAAATYYFQVSANLQSWTPLSPGNSAIAVLTNPARFRLTLPSGMRFCRLVVATP